MPIYRLLQNSPLGPEEIKVLTDAYEQTLRKLSLVDRNDPVTEIIANKIIELGQRGVREAGGRSWSWRSRSWVSNDASLALLNHAAPTASAPCLRFILHSPEVNPQGWPLRHREALTYKSVLRSATELTNQPSRS